MARVHVSHMVRGALALKKTLFIDDGVGVFQPHEVFDDLEGVCHELAHWLALRAPLEILSREYRGAPTGWPGAGFTEGLTNYIKHELPGTKHSADHNEAQAQAIVMLVLYRMGAHKIVDRPYSRLIRYACQNSFGTHLYDEKWARKTIRRYRRQPCIQALADQLFQILNHPEILGVGGSDIL